MTNPANPSPEDSDEPRREHRQRVLKGGTIITGISNSEVGCTLRNQHEGGAELKVPLEARVPDRFLLYVAVDGVAYRCEVRWRRSDRIGVRFTGKEPKPKLHYG
ncbi:MAG: PilZ domain-containing protein [Mesorhizobium sp.]